MWRQLPWFFLFSVSLYCACGEGRRSDYTDSKPELVIHDGHRGYVGPVVFSPDGKILATGSTDNTVKLWDVPTNRLLKTLKIAVASMAFSPNGRILAIGCKDKTIRFLDISTGQLHKTLIGHQSDVLSVAFSPDGRTMASGSNDETVKIWDVASGTTLKTLKGHKNFVSSVVYRPDGKMLASGSWDETVILWDVEMGRALRRIDLRKDKKRPHFTDRYISGADYMDSDFMPDPNLVYYLSFSPNGETLIIGGDNIQFWDVATGKVMKTIDESGVNGFCVSLSPDGRVLATRGCKNSDPINFIYFIYLWDIENGKIRKILKGNEKSPVSLAFSPDGKYLVSGSSDETAILWDVASGRPLKIFRGYQSHIQSVSFSPDGKIIASGTRDGSLELWHLTAERNFTKIKEHTDSVESISFSPDAKLFATMSSDRTLKIWDAVSGRLWALTSHDNTLTIYDVVSGQTLKLIENIEWDFNFSFAFSPKNNVFGMSSLNKITIFNTMTGHVHKIEAGKIGYQDPIAFSPDGKLVAAADGIKIFIWDVATGFLIKTLEKDSRKMGVDYIAFDPHGNIVSTQMNSNTIETVNISTGKLIKSIEVASKFLLTFSPTGGTFATIQEKNFQPGRPDFPSLLGGNNASVINVHDSRTGRLIKTLEGPTQKINAISFSPDGKYIASGGDRGIELWDVKEGAIIATLISFDDDESIAFSPSGYYFSTLEGDERLRWFFPGPVVADFAQYESVFACFSLEELIKKSYGEAPDVVAPPDLKLKDSYSLQKVTENDYLLEVEVTDLEMVETVRIFVNGRLAYEKQINSKKKEFTQSLPLAAKMNRITAIAYNAKGFSSYPVYVDVEVHQTEIPKPNLFVLAVGISEYQHWQDLQYAHEDAEDIARVFEKQRGRLFAEVSAVVLINEEAEPENIIRHLEAMKDIRPQDVAVIFIAGHGHREQKGELKKYYFLTPQSKPSRNGKGLLEPERNALDWEKFHNRLSKMKCRTVLLMDTCNAGAISTETIVPNDELVASMLKDKRSGVAILSSSKGSQSSEEKQYLEQGLFTWAILEALGEKRVPVGAIKDLLCDSNGDGYISFRELAEYVIPRVEDLSTNPKTPRLSRMEIMGDFPIAMAN